MMSFRKRRPARFTLIALAIPAVFLAACAPYQPPAFLQNTAGAPVILHDQTYTGEAFTLRYPVGWRVITPPAEAAESVVLAGENCQIVYVSTIPLQPPSPPECPAELMRFEPLEQQGIYVYGGALAENWDTFAPVFSQITASLTANG